MQAARASRDCSHATLFYLPRSLALAGAVTRYAAIGGKLPAKACRPSQRVTGAIQRFNAKKEPAAYGQQLCTW